MMFTTQRRMYSGCLHWKDKLSVLRIQVHYVIDSYWFPLPAASFITLTQPRHLTALMLSGTMEESDQQSLSDTRKPCVVFWVRKPCSLMRGHQYFGETYHLHLQDKSRSRRKPNISPRSLYPPTRLHKLQHSSSWPQKPSKTYELIWHMSACYDDYFMCSSH